VETNETLAEIQSSRWWYGRPAHLEDHGTGRVAVAQEVVAGTMDRSAVRDPAAARPDTSRRHGVGPGTPDGRRRAQTLGMFGGDLR